jgi:hypothetical protein
MQPEGSHQPSVDAALPQPASASASAYADAYADALSAEARRRKSLLEKYRDRRQIIAVRRCMLHYAAMLVI